MKRVLTLLLLVICTAASAQIYQNHPEYGDGWKRHKIDSTLTIPKDTALRSNVLDPGAIVYNSGDSSIYAWNGAYWVKQGRAAATGGVTSAQLSDSLSNMTLQRVTEQGNITSVNSIFNGGINAMGNLNIGLTTTSRVRLNRFVDLIGNQPDSSNGAFITWLKSNGTRVGAIGDGASTDNDLYFSALNNNNIRFSFVITDTPFAPAKLPLVLRPDGSSLFSYPNTVANIGSNTLAVNGNILVENFVNKAAFMTFNDNLTPEKAYVGKLGNPEANLSINMDYSTRIHKMDDSSRPALWLALSNRNAAWALQYANAGQTQSQSPSYDVWANSTKPYLFRQDTIEARFYNRLRVDSGVFLRQAAGTYKFFIQRTDQLQGLGISAGSGRLLLNNYDSVNSVFPDYQFLSTKGTVTKVLSFFAGTSGNVGIGPSTAPNSTLHVQGSLATAITTVTTAITLDATHATVLVNNTGSVTITLPSASACPGRTYAIKKISAAANDVVIDGNGAETIDNAPSKTLTLQYSGIIFQSNGTSWFILGGHAAATIY